LGAINSGDGGFMRITSLGRTLALLPVAPAYGKVLVLAEQRATTDTMLLPYAICLVAALSVREPFLPLLIDPGKYICLQFYGSTFCSCCPTAMCKRWYVMYAGHVRRVFITASFNCANGTAQSVVAAWP
jgi:HrpA-like RNA helicase